VPRVTYYTKDELRMASQQLGTGIIAEGIRAYDRVANLFHEGEMYSSFLLHVLSLMDLSVPLVHLPICGTSSSETTVQYMRSHSATAIFSTVKTLVS
jgi:phenylacetate-CoA ligase